MPKRKRKESRAAERRSQRPTVIDRHQAYSIDETGASLDMCRAKVYGLIRDGRLPVIELDGRKRVPGWAIIQLTQPTAQPAA